MKSRHRHCWRHVGSALAGNCVGQGRAAMRKTGRLVRVAHSSAGVTGRRSHHPAAVLGDIRGPTIVWLRRKTGLLVVRRVAVASSASSTKAASAWTRWTTVVAHVTVAVAVERSVGVSPGVVERYRGWVVAAHSRHALMSLMTC